MVEQRWYFGIDVDDTPGVAKDGLTRQDLITLLQQVLDTVETSIPDGFRIIIAPDTPGNCLH